MCVFHQESYITLLKLLITSISKKSKINKDTTDILIITSPSFEPLIKKELECFDLPLHYYLLNLHTLMESSCCKLKIFQYNEIDKYQKLLYLDTDVLVNSDVNVLFDIDISTENLYALEEGNIGNDYWGTQFFDFAKFNRDTSAFSAGVFYFMNSLSMKTLFQDTNNHIADHMSKNKSLPVCLDQPFLVYNSFITNKYNNQMMKQYLENNPNDISPSKIIYHFPGGPGHYPSKHTKMTSFWSKMDKDKDVIPYTIFDTRNEMIKHYCNKITNPKILEIGVFKGDFLDYIISNCNIGSIDGVDFFDRIMCSGDANGNNVIYYNVGQSYIELTEKYKDLLNVKLYKSDSVEFLKNQEDNTYDIIYIDGDHSYDGIKNDLLNAYNKIKNNGYIMGHDYEMNMNKAQHTYQFGVKQAVDEFCNTYKQTIIAKAIDGCVSYSIYIVKK